ncbi:hypothetical protein N7451_001723 [Penicillium sp. IBT 35674x]|nr:hypothetical protein N7451_001723 [Penicillium sp. IBT 35674x]
MRYASLAFGLLLPLATSAVEIWLGEKDVDASPPDMVITETNECIAVDYERWRDADTFDIRGLKEGQRFGVYDDTKCTDEYAVYGEDGFYVACSEGCKAVYLFSS